MSTISARAASARENARQRDGKFGSYTLPDAGTEVDLDMSWLEDGEAGGDPFTEPADEPVAPARRRGARTDIHAPGSPDFDPQAYSEPLGVFYVGSDDERGAGAGDAQAAAMTMQAMREQGWKLGHGGPTQCGHCGSHMLYSALIKRDDAREYIFVGEDCLKGTFGRTSEEFAKLREEHAAAVKNQARKARIRALIEGDPESVDEFFRKPHPVLADLTYPQLHTSDFLESVGEKMMRDGYLSQRQVEAAEGAIARGIKRSVENQTREQRKAELIAQGVSVPTGKVHIEGTITSTKVVESQYGSTTKMRVETAEGWAVWGSVPKAISDPRGLVGATVAFDATVEASNDDPLFGFASRPTKAAMISPAPRESADEMYARLMLDVEDHQQRAEESLAALEQLVPTGMCRDGESVVRAADRIARQLGGFREDQASQGLDAQTREQIIEHVAVLAAAEARITQVEEGYLEEHRYIQRNSADIDLAARRAQAFIPSQEAYIADLETGLQNTTDPKQVAKVKRSLTGARKDLQAVKDSLPSQQEKARAALEEFERSKARVRFFRGLLARYRDGRGEALTAPR